jgi:hypothetical protein
LQNSAYIVFGGKRQVYLDQTVGKYGPRGCGRKRKGEQHPVQLVHYVKDTLDIQLLTIRFPLPGHAVEYPFDNKRFQSKEHNNPEDPDYYHKEKKATLLFKDHPSKIHEIEHHKSAGTDYGSKVTRKGRKTVLNALKEQRLLEGVGHLDDHREYENGDKAKPPYPED